MNKHKDFAAMVESFFTEYLVKERGASHHTIRSYRDTFVQFIEYMAEQMKIKPDKILLSHIDKSRMTSFLNWLENERGASVSTRNQRRAAFCSFFKYLMYEDPIHMSQWKLAMSIKSKKGDGKALSYLTIDGIKALFEQVDIETRIGRRDLTLLSVLYNTGARVSEIISLTPLSVRTEKPYIVRLYGKGSKHRIVPVDDETIGLLKKYMEENCLNERGSESRPLFFNTWGEPLTAPGITYIVQKYASMARMLHPELIPEKISPHVFRHSRAMHLLQAGVNLVYIRDLLGHVSVQTTEIYARADSKLKREALEKAYVDIGVKEPEVKSWDRNQNLKDFLKNLT